MNFAALLLVLVLAPGALAQNTVTQDGAATAQEGESVQLNCSYTGTEYSLHWYRQSPGSPPRFVALLSSSGRETRENFTLSLDTKAKSSSLYLNSSRLADSAVYLCAMVHGAGRAQGTRHKTRLRGRAEERKRGWARSTGEKKGKRNSLV